MKEIERKFLVNKDLLPSLNKSDGQQISQGYLINTKDLTLRIRTTNKKGFITLKGKTEGISREEYEYEIPRHEADAIMTNNITQKIEKRRHEVFYKNKKWEVDFFSGNLKGLIIAEVELYSEKEDIEIPLWCDTEVSENQKYYNSELIKLNSIKDLF